MLGFLRPEEIQEELLAAYREGLRDFLRVKLETLGSPSLFSIATTYFPELDLSPDSAVASLARYLVKVGMPHPETAHHMLALSGTDLAVALRSHLRDFVDKRPWLETLRMMSYTELRDVVARSGIQVPPTSKKPRLLAKILLTMSRDDAVQERFLRELDLSIVYASLRARLEGVLASLGYPLVKAMVEEFVPEVAYCEGAPCSLVRRLSRLLRTAVPPEATFEMSAMESSHLVGAFCRWLGVRLLKQPEVAAIRRMSRQEVLNFSARVGLGRPHKMQKRRVVAGILSKMARDNSTKELVLRELNLLVAAPPAPMSYFAQCPEVVRTELATRASRRGASPHDGSNDVYAVLRERIDSLLVSLGYTAVKELTDKYLPEVAERFRPPSTMPWRLAGLLPDVVPPEIAENMAGLGDADMVGALCHWLGIRLQRMPWVEEMRRMSYQELHDLSVRLGISSFRSTPRRLIADILAATSEETDRDGMLMEQLLQELSMPGGFPLPRNDTFVGHIDECPPALRAKLLSEARAVDLPAVAYRGFMPRLKVLLLGLGQPALRDLVEKYGPPHLELRQGAPVVTMSQILMGLFQSVVPFSAAREMATLSGTRLIGTLCHWLSVRLMQLPHHRELMRLSFRALGRLAAKLRVAMPTTAHKRRFVADLLASASQDREVNQRLVLELNAIGGQVVEGDPADVGYIEECPESVRLALPQLEGLA